MFANAVRLARGFTRPVVISVFTANKALLSSLGAFVVVNRDGWVLTANHVVEQYAAMATNKQRLADYNAQVDAIKNNAGLLSEQKKTKLRKLGGPPLDAITDFAFWWGQDGVTFTIAHVVPEVDLALCKLDNFDTTSVQNFPAFKDPSRGIDPGTSLCRLGFPFTAVKDGYNEATGVFTVDASSTVFFPNEGMYTRTIEFSNPPLVAFIETSSPGLRGQSGGPIFDTKGGVWGIQSQTGHLALGFSPPVPGGKPGQVEHQFLNVGRGAHPETITNLLQNAGVAFDTTPY
jgi:S1-C subfamily serine protease